MTKFHWGSFTNEKELTDKEFDESMVKLTRLIEANPNTTESLNNFLMVLDIIDDAGTIKAKEIMNELYDALLKSYNQFSRTQCACGIDGFDEALCIFEKFCQDNNVELVLPNNEQGN